MTRPFTDQQSQLPTLGVGLGLRRSLFEATLAHRELIDWLEIVPENHMGKGGRSLELIREAKAAGFPLASHGVNLSIGSVDPLDEDYLSSLEKLFQIAEPVWFSDHLCFAKFGGAYVNDLIPLPHTWEAVEHVVKRVKQIQQRFGQPFLLENISYYCSFDQGELTEAQFLSEILEQADCGLMLDVNNVYVNAQNHGYDPVAFLDQIPIERAVQFHMAGHLRKPDMIIDTHGSAVCTDVWDLLAETLKRVQPKGILLERDQGFPEDFDELLKELSMIRKVQSEVSALTYQPEVSV